MNEKMFNFMKKATEKDDKEKRKREKKERKDVKKRDRSSMSAEELLRLDEVRFFFRLFISYKLVWLKNSRFIPNVILFVELFLVRTRGPFFWYTKYA